MDAIFPYLDKLVHFGDIFINTLSTIFSLEYHTFSSMITLGNLISVKVPLFDGTFYYFSMPHIPILSPIFATFFDFLVKPIYLFGFTDVDNVPMYFIMLSLMLWVPILWGFAKLGRFVIGLISD